ncbi:MAG: adenosine kinase [Leptospiraceae bacterium]|nr:adenosine kinase [Leptospiraceae bacterium]
MAKFDVFGLGNALVDIVTTCEDSFLKDNKIQKGVMTLVDTKTQIGVIEKLHPDDLSLRSGGSAANTLIGVANSGGTGCYTGKVAMDTDGEFYKLDMEKLGIAFEIKPVSGDGATGTCLVLTTPDGERTMLTSLGISSHISKSDIDEEAIKNSEIVYVEGYLWDRDNSKEASVYTMELAKKHGKKVAFTYSDPFCVNRSRADFVKLTKELVDIVFCNHEEAMSLTETSSPEDALRALGDIAKLAFMTWSANGAFIVNEGIEKLVSGFKVKPIDSNGAGDGFAAGVLYGLTHGLSLDQACKWGNYYASRVILEVGPRLSYSMKSKLKEIIT